MIYFLFSDAGYDVVSHSHRGNSECGQVSNVLHKEGINSTQQEHLVNSVEDPGDKNIAF